MLWPDSPAAFHMRFAIGSQSALALGCAAARLGAREMPSAPDSALRARVSGR